MALIKQLETPFSVTVSYWRICNLDVDYQNGITRVTLCVYKDEKSRLDGKSPIPGMNIETSLNLIPSDVNVRETIYHLIKQDPFFSDSIDA